MATLDSPITPQNIVDRFADYVVATGNTSITWGTNAMPFAEFDVAQFAGANTGRDISISGTAISTAEPTDPISALNIYNTLVAETASYTNIRNLNAILNVEGGGGNTGSRATAGVIFNDTAVSHLNISFRQDIGAPAASDVLADSQITSAGLETFFDTLRTAYNTARGTTTTIQVNVCHASCHSSCHSSRGRR